MRVLDLPEHIIPDQTTFEIGCYYATTTRDVSTMQVFFIEVVDVYADTIVYRIAPQSLHCSLTLQSAKHRLQDVKCNVANVSSTPIASFQAHEVIIYASLLTKLFD